MRESPAPSTPLQIVLFRPHQEIWFKDPVRHILRGESLPHKYGPMFDALLAGGAKIHVSTFLARRPGLKGWLQYLLDPFELMLWARLNRIESGKVGFVFTRAGLRDKDVLFFMHYGNFTHEHVFLAEQGERLARCLADVKIQKVVHFTHYAYRPAIGARNLALLGSDLHVAENDLKRHSAFYRKHFGALDADFSCLPFIASPRFQSTTPFRERAPKLVATGSITYRMTDPDFTGFYGTDDLQPLRRKIHDRAHEFGAEIDSLISDLSASRPADAKPASTWRRLLQRMSRRRHPQHGYYRKNIVEVYNSYRMFAVPEEVCDLPAIGVVEGMACGSAYFGLDDPMYRDIGMIPGVHYVSHDGTPEGLAAKVRHYQQPENLAELEQIAARGQALVDEKFRAEVVYPNFVKMLATRCGRGTA